MQPGHALMVPVRRPLIGAWPVFVGPPWCHAAMSYRWGSEARAVLDPRLRGVVRVLGGPGTGKSCLLIEAAAARIAAGIDPESVLLLTGSGRIGARTRSALTTTLLRSQEAGSCARRRCGTSGPEVGARPPACGGKAGHGLPAVIREPLVR